MLVSTFVVFLSISVNGLGPQVNTSSGTLSGEYLTTRKGRTFRSFIGIPYAKPPIGELRFKPPVPAGPWEGTLDVTRKHAVCPQSSNGVYHPHSQEDCLYLNVYTPEVTGSDSKLPVIFYIHGGGFFYGSARPDHYGPKVLLDEDVVLVAPNYRIGALGFLSTGDEVVPGNNGLKDQALALKWVQTHIADFGGDPERVVLLGHSAGASSAHFHMFSPLSRGLFKGVIAHSGTALGSWALFSKEEAVQNAKKLGELLQCDTSNSNVLVDCLRGVDPADIINQEKQFMEWAVDPMIAFRPGVEVPHSGSFLSQHPLDLLKSGNVAEVPLITGITSEDGGMKGAAYYNNSQWIDDMNKRFLEVAPYAMQYHQHPDKNTVSTEIRKYYVGQKSIDGTTKDEVTMMFTDTYFLLGAAESVHAHYKWGKSPVYYYCFGYRGSESYNRIFGDATHDYGVIHADDMIYLFELGQRFPDYKPTEEDAKMMDVFTNLWANFARTGKPTEEGNKFPWKPVESFNLEYYHIKGPGERTMDKGLYSDRVKFLKELSLCQPKCLVKDEL